MNINISTEARSRTLVLSSDTNLLRIIETLFSHLVGYEYDAEPLSNIMQKKRIDPDLYDLVIMDVADGAILDDPQFLAARDLISGVPVIFVSDALTNDHMRNLVKLDGEDWLVKPIDRRAMLESIATLFKKLRTGRKKVHAVVSCGGGAGGTTLAIMLSYFLGRSQKRRKPKVALFDLDFSTAAVAAYLNIENSFDLSTVIDRPERVDLEFVNIIQKQQESGYSVFSFESPEVYSNLRGSELILRMLDVISFQHDHTVLDIPAYETPWRQQILSGVDSITFVTNPTVPALQFAKASYARIKDSLSPDHPVTFVVNRSQSGLFGSGIGKKEIGLVFGELKVIVLPDERKVMMEALNRGVLPIEISPRSGFCKGVELLAGSLRKSV